MSRSARIASAAVVAALLLGGTVMASAGTDLQANDPQVATDPASNSTARFPTNKSNEPTIAVDRVNPSVLLAGANDEQQQPPCGPGPVRGPAPGVPDSDCSFFPWVGTSGLYRSLDAGASWHNLGMMDDFWSPSTKTAGTRVVSDGDPVIVIGPRPLAGGGFSTTERRAYYAMLGALEAVKGFEYVIVSYSDDFATAATPTWSDPVIATTKTAASDFNDKNWIGVDDDPTSPFFGRVYVSWTEFRSATGTGYANEPLMMAASTNGAASFGSPKQLSPAGNNGTGNGRQGSNIATGPDGTVYVAFEQGFSQVVSVSRDGGSKWTRPQLIGAVANIDDPIPGANFRTSSFPVLGVDHTDGTVWAAWVTRTADGGRLVVTSSSDRGKSWAGLTTVGDGTQGYAFFPGLSVASNGRVDVAFQALLTDDPTTFGIGNASIDSYAASLPKGGSWSPVTPISTASSDPAASSTNALGQQFWGDYNQLVSTDAAAWFISTDSRNGAGCAAVDAYQHFLIDGSLARRSDGADRRGFRNTGVDPALHDPDQKPAPPQHCPINFGNTDSYVAAYDPNTL
jgi:hypothetical protein